MSDHFKIWDAVMCCECDEVFEMGPSSCPSCTCTTFIHLSSFVQPTSLREEIDQVRQLHSIFKAVEKL